VVNDPYLSIWSAADQLNAATTTHWTGDEKPLYGLLRVDGEAYRFMGARQECILQSIAPMAYEERWEGAFTRQIPAAGWQNLSFDDSGWERRKAAFGDKGQENMSTEWSGDNTDIYVRRHVSLSAEDLQSDLYVRYSHDDVFELYINGTKVVDTGITWVNGEQLHLEGDMKKLLQEGDNVIAAHCHNTTGGSYADFGLFRNVMPEIPDVKVAEQKSVDVLACNTYYTFTCGPVDLTVVFTAPMFMDDYDMMSMPINYISTQVTSNDGAAHSVQLYMDATQQMAVNEESQPTVASYVDDGGLRAVRTGTIDQPILARKGDGVCIDWGYFYVSDVNGQVGLGEMFSTEKAFLESGQLPADGDREIVARKSGEIVNLAYVHDFGQTQSASSFAMVGYDEVWDIEYMYERYKGYWAHGGKVTIAQAFRQMQDQYVQNMERSRQWDRTIYDDGMKAGGKEYAEMLSASYRHVIAAHKLFCDKEGNLLWFSKENNSNGCVNTVDLTYPEAPLPLVYNPDLQKAMMTSIFEYSRSGRWTKPFAAHDLGTYPIANGQVYGGDMPVEEAGNMLTLAATLSMLDGNTAYVAPYWDIITTWADYLTENGLDPENQLCTDDFAGHWAHNCNLSLKAICGVAGYALMAELKGDKETADKYMAKAREMASKWEEMALEGDHYRLAFDRNDTWSQKYNMVWDKLWNTGLFSDKVYEREISYYLAKQNKYGLPLDCRMDYTKSDWIMWTAAMSPNQDTFRKLMLPVYTYINETQSRVPISDWSDTKTGKMVGFKARSVIGGYWMRVLADKMAAARK
ncbi:MAG: glutaminase domain-containing protein, partial [Bacteroidaceae bacterium]